MAKVTVDIARPAQARGRRWARNFVEAGAIQARDEVVLQMQGSTPAGREYRVPGTKARYTASAPGQAPAIREAVYVNSWTTSAVVERGQAIHAAAYSPLKTEDGRYLLGDLLENGTAGIAPRPHVAPAAEIMRQRVPELVRSATK